MSRIASAFGVFTVSLFAAVSGAAADQGELPPAMYSVTVQRTIQAVNYLPNGSTKIDLKGTILAPSAKGEAKVETSSGAVRVQAKFENLVAAVSFGGEYLTYVLWAISPEGRPRNLGEVVPKGQRAQLNVTTSLQAFGLMLTAEPYFAVSTPSDVVVMENIVREDTKGSITVVKANYELLKRGAYVNYGLQNAPLDPRIPLDLYQARNAVHIAQLDGADHYSAETFARASDSLRTAEIYQRNRADRKSVIMSARVATQTAEDARAIAIRRADDERDARQKAEAAAREAAAKEAAEQEAEQKRQAQAEAERAAYEKQQAEAAAARAEVDRLRSLQQEEQARRVAEQAEKQSKEAEAARLKAELEKQQLRENLLRQLNTILETKDTSRGLVVNMGDLLFDTGKSDIRAAAKEALARLSGIALSHPGLNLAIEGYTDSVGSDEFNLALSEKRADAVRAYLMEQGLDPETLTARGFGKAMPIAPNDTAKGRQQNRRVEIIVSGEVIGVKIGQ